jgi:predicted ATP-dependent endonuclease of OLD family
MEIRRVEYKNIYGILSGKLDFTQGENFIVGINGCGKTTVLNLIRWVLGPSFPDLCTLHHDLIKIDVKHGKYLYEIESRILKDKHVLKVVTKDKSRNFKPITTPLTIVPRQIRGYRGIEDIRTHYEHLSPDNHEIATLNFLIEELPSPVFIGLERSIEKGQSDQRVRRRRQYPMTTEGITPLETATILMRDAFNTSRRRLVEINDELNRKVLELSFSGVLHSRLKRPVLSPKESAKKIKRLKDRFENTAMKNVYSKALSSEGVRSAVIKYLDELSSILNGESKEDEIWVMLNQHNFDRASTMLDLFEENETKTKEVQLEITKFTNAVNKFIGDSGKIIIFDDDTGTPYFKSHASSENLRLSQLSSGEAQVIVLLSYFAFLAKGGIPIVIDEPELSLHVQWQKYFVDAVKEVMPEECQTIMATHSPEICGAEDVNVQAISMRVTQ